MSVYEQNQILGQYLDLHFGEPDEVLPWPTGPRDALDYPVRCVRELLDPAAVTPTSRALDVGCAVGRSAFELRAFCSEVIAVDLSRRFIEAAQALQAYGRLDFYRVDEGRLTTPVRYCVPTELPRDGVQFEVGDACRLREDLGAFDVVLNANLIDRLPDPGLFLDRLPRLVKPGGQLLLSSPFTWLEEFTPPERWIGGYEQDGEPRTTWQALCEHLQSWFDLRAQFDLPFLIREHARKYQWSVARAGRWIRRPAGD